MIELHLHGSASHAEFIMAIVQLFIFSSSAIIAVARIKTHVAHQVYRIEE